MDQGRLYGNSVTNNLCVQPRKSLRFGMYDSTIMMLLLLYFSCPSSQSLLLILFLATTQSQKIKVIKTIIRRRTKCIWATLPHSLWGLCFCIMSYPPLASGHCTLWISSNSDCLFGSTPSLSWLSDSWLQLLFLGQRLQNLPP